MATTPTQNAVPSEAARDLKFNSGKIDEFVTSKAREYKDRFGESHLTIEGMKWMVEQVIETFKVDMNQAIIAAGYIPMDSFQQCAEITLRNQILRDEVTGEYYRWDGDLPKSVPAGSTPESAGGVGVGMWVSVGDASLRTDVRKYRYFYGATSIYYIPSVSFDDETDNRDAIYNHGGNIFIPKGLTVRCNLFPDDDVTIFKGDGKILTKDMWGNEHVFDVSLANNGSTFTASGRISKSARDKTKCRVGIVGDSISDGAYSSGWVANPTDGNDNLSSTNYDHNTNGGSGAWFRTFTDLINTLAVGNGLFIYQAMNASSSGKRLIDGWAYRNFDYGFFKNSAYSNAAPDVCFMGMGVNDGSKIDELGFDVYLHEFEKFIRKVWGYGGSVCFLSMNQHSSEWGFLESSIKKQIERKYPQVEFLDLTPAVNDMYTDLGSYGLAEISQRPGTTTFDKTHYSTIGHQFVGAYAAKEVMKSMITPVRHGSNLSPCGSSTVYPHGYPSGKRYDISLSPVSGGMYLDELKVIPSISPDNENVILKYYVWVDDNNIALNILEPWSPKLSSEQHTRCAVRVNDIRNSDYVTAILAPTLPGQVKTKRVSSCGIIKKGLNIISITYGGAPSRVYLPSLLFRRDCSNCMSPMSYINITNGRKVDASGKSLSGNDFTLTYDIERISDEAPDYRNSSGSFLTQSVTFSSMPPGYGVIFNHKRSSDSGVLVKRTASGFDVIKLESGNKTAITVLPVTFTGEVAITKAGNSLSIIPASGSANTQTVDGFLGGGMSIMNDGDSQGTASIKTSYMRSS